MSRGPWKRKPETEPMPPRLEKLTKLSVEEKEALEREVQERRAMVENKDDGEFTSTAIERNPEAVDSMRRDLKRKETLLQADEDLVARGREKDKIHREIKAIQDKILPFMPSHNEMWKKTGSQDSDMAVRKNMHFQKTFINDLLRLKDLQRRLESQDPTAGNLEFIRPK